MVRTAPQLLHIYTSGYLNGCAGSSLSEMGCKVEHGYAASLGGLLVLEITDYLHLWSAVDGIRLGDQPDRTIWRWTAHGSYIAKSAYTMLHSGSIKMAGHRFIWKT
jgi:hypothetical protein